jgi:hypothetical protein
MKLTDIKIEVPEFPGFRFLRVGSVNKDEFCIPLSNACINYPDCTPCRWYNSHPSYTYYFVYEKLPEIQDTIVKWNDISLLNPFVHKNVLIKDFYGNAVAVGFDRGEYRSQYMTYTRDTLNKMYPYFANLQE